MRTENYQYPRDWLQRLLGLSATSEVRQYATEAEIVAGGLADQPELKEDVLTQHYVRCTNCGDVLARRRTFSIGWWFGGNDCGWIPLRVWSCSVCGTLTSPDQEHRYHYRDDS